MYLRHIDFSHWRLTEGQFSRECEDHGPVLPKDRKLFYFRLASLIVWDDRFFPGSSSFLKLLTVNLLRSESLEQLNGPEITYLLFLCTLQGPRCTL